MRRPRTISARHYAGVVTVLAVLLILILAACTGGDSGAGTSPTSASPEATAGSSLTTLGFAEGPPTDWNGGAIPFDELPPEAHETLALIATDGPYPYRQDGSTFQNREGILPDHDLGFYREFTVETPGSPDRGARRLVVGDDSAAYYTDDHYDSFRFVTP
jgi:ribonuclease T1